MDDANERAVGVELNGHVWDGAKWVPAPPSAPRGSAPTTFPQGTYPSGSPTAPLGMWQRIPQTGGFTDPHYGYGLTRQAADDLQFIVRFHKVMIIIWIVLVALSLILIPVLFGGFLAAIGNLVAGGAR